MVTIFWHRYYNFFELWKDDNLLNRQFIYVIGESSIYIGAIGVMGGHGGIRQRYQKQYIERSKAIFDADESMRVYSYAGCLLRNVTPQRLKELEDEIQYNFIFNADEERALFTFRHNYIFKKITISHQGKTPRFIIS